MKTFGPFPSRRLGSSLGINNMPSKICSYACIYCQLGIAVSMEIKRSRKYHPEQLADEVLGNVNNLHKRNENIDYLTFIPDGEPTLDSGLGQEINLLLVSGIKIAVITNGSLLWQKDVRKDLERADLVSLKIDAVENGTWKKVNRPHKSLTLEQILRAMFEFSTTFKGKLITETMLIDGVNDGAESLEAVSSFIHQLHPDIAYLTVPTRPPARKNVHASTEDTLNNAFQTFVSKGINTDYLIGF